jgi:hypothetical protein
MKMFRSVGNRNAGSRPPSESLPLILSGAPWEPTSPKRFQSTRPPNSWGTAEPLSRFGPTSENVRRRPTAVSI